MRTHVIKISEIERTWRIVDADGAILGRLASEVAKLLRGKHKPGYSPHLDCGDPVVIVNAEKVVLTGRKLDQKKRIRHSGYPGGLRVTSYRKWMASQPTEIVRKAVRGMLPKNRLGRSMMTKLKVYAGPDHPHTAQKPAAYEVNG